MYWVPEERLYFVKLCGLYAVMAYSQEDADRQVRRAFWEAVYSPRIEEGKEGTNV